MADLRPGQGGRRLTGSNLNINYYSRSAYNPTLSKLSTTSSSKLLSTNDQSHDHHSNDQGLMMVKKKISFSTNKLSLPKTTTTTTDSNSSNHGSSLAGESRVGGDKRIIEFTPGTDDQDESDGDTSPPLWKNTRSTSLPLQQQQQQHHRVLSPTSRSQEIARGRLELMEMIRNMPENSYELSLKDLIEQKQLTTTVDDNEQEAVIDEEKQRKSSSSSNSTNYNNNFSSISMISSRGMIKNDNIRVLKRSKSIDSNSNGPFLLKMFLPISSFGSKKKNIKKMNKNSNNNSFKKGTYYAKVSPRPTPPLMEGEKRFSVAGETEINGLESISEGGGSSNSSTGSRKMGGLLSGCWSFHTKKTKTTALKGSHY